MCNMGGLLLSLHISSINLRERQELVTYWHFHPTIRKSSQPQDQRLLVWWLESSLSIIRHTTRQHTPRLSASLVWWHIGIYTQPIAIHRSHKLSVCWCGDPNHHCPSSNTSQVTTLPGSVCTGLATNHSIDFMLIDWYSLTICFCPTGM